MMIEKSLQVLIFRHFQNDSANVLVVAELVHSEINNFGVQKSHGPVSTVRTPAAHLICFPETDVETEKALLCRVVYIYFYILLFLC